MKLYLIVSCLISVSLSAPLDNTYKDFEDTNVNETQNEISFNIGFLLSPPEKEVEHQNHLSSLFELLFQTYNQNLSEKYKDSNTIFAYGNSKENKSENEPYTIFDPEMDPSDSKNYGKDEGIEPLKILFSSFPLLKFNPAEDESITEKTPSPISYIGNILPDVPTLSVPPTLEDEPFQADEDVKEITENLLTTETNIEKLGEKSKLFLLKGKSDGAELYEQQANLIESMESTLKSLRTYFDKQTREQKQADYHLNNVLVIASIGIIYLLLIFTFCSFKSLFYGDKDEKDDTQSLISVKSEEYEKQ